MAEGCALVAPDPFIRTILLSHALDLDEEKAQNERPLARFEELLVRHFVASNPNLKYCPYPEYTNTASCPAAASRMSLTTVVPIVSCSARGVGGRTSQSSSPLQAQAGGGTLSSAGKEHKFCFGCTIESDHCPIVCGAARMWLKKFRDDSETANWIKSNTKGSESTFEKNGGVQVVFSFSLDVILRLVLTDV